MGGTPLPFMSVHIIMTTLNHFGEDANGRDGNGHVSKSKGKLYQIRNFFNFLNFKLMMGNPKLRLKPLVNHIPVKISTLPVTHFFKDE
jgi:hypothetical protein